MARLSGRDMTVQVGSLTLQGVTTNSSTNTAEKADATGADSANNFREHVSTLKTGTLSVDGFVGATTARLSGVGMSVTIGTLTVKGVTSMSDSYTTEKSDASGADTTDDWREFVPGMTTGTASVGGHYDSTTTSSTLPAMSLIGTETTLTLTYDTSSTTTKVSGQAHIDDVTHDTNIDGSVDFTIAATWAEKPTEGAGFSNVSRALCGTETLTTVTSAAGAEVLSATAIVDTVDFSSDLESAISYSLGATWTADPSA